MSNKAFIFTIDIIIAITVVTLIFAVSTFYIAKAGDESASKLQTIRIGYDILAVLDYDGTLDALNADGMDVGLNRMLPINYHMRLKADCAGEPPIIVETTDIYPKDRFIGTGKRVFISNSGKNCVADFTIWLK